MVINGTSETFTGGSFAIQVEDYNPANFTGRDFAVKLGSVEEAINSNEEIAISDLLDSEVNGSTAWIHVPGYNVAEEVERLRLAFTLFRRDTLFQDNSSDIRSVIIGVQSKLSNVIVGFLKPTMMNASESEYNASCVIWDENKEGMLVNGHTPHSKTSVLQFGQRRVVQWLAVMVTMLSVNAPQMNMVDTLDCSL